MPILLTEQQWTDVKNDADVPVRVQDPMRSANFVLLPAEVYERLKSLFDVDPITAEERRFQLQQFGHRAGWDDPEMDVYDDLDPRRAS